MARIKLEDIREFMGNDGWQVISQEYHNLKEPMEFLCPEGHSVYATFAQMRNKKECPICAKNIYKTPINKVVPKKKDSFRVLACDQATHITGWSIFDDGMLVASGVFHVPDGVPIARADGVRQWLLSMIQMWTPDHVGFEDIQLQEDGSTQRMSVTVFKTLAHLQGILFETCYERQIPYTVVASSVWRQHCQVKGKYRADKKRSMQYLVKEWYDVTVTDDESDAIGIGKYVSDINIQQGFVSNWE